MLRMSRKSLLILSTIVLGIILIFGYHKNIEAASRVKTLNVNTTYTTRLTGAENHRIMFKYTDNKGYSEFKDCKIYIDGKLKKTISSNNYGSYYYEVKLLSVNANRNLIYIENRSDSDYVDFNNIYEYKNGKLILLKNLCTLTRCSGDRADKLLTGWARGTLYSFDGKTLCIKWQDSTVATGNIYYITSYTISGNKITKNSTANAVRSLKNGKTNPKWTARYTMKAYTTAGGRNVAFTVNTNDIITIKVMTVKNGRRYLQVTNSKGKSGWLLNPNTYSDGKYDGYFKECILAG